MFMIGHVCLLVRACECWCVRAWVCVYVASVCASVRVCLCNP